MSFRGYPLNSVIEGITDAIVTSARNLGYPAEKLGDRISDNVHNQLVAGRYRPNMDKQSSPYEQQIALNNGRANGKTLMLNCSPLGCGSEMYKQFVSRRTEDVEYAQNLHKQFIASYTNEDDLLTQKLYKQLASSNQANNFIMPNPVTVIYNGRTTIVIWDDKTKTVVKCSDNEQFDEYDGFSAALLKKLCGSTSFVKRLMKKAVIDRQNISKRSAVCRTKHEQVSHCGADGCK